MRNWQPDHAAIGALAKATDSLGLCAFGPVDSFCDGLTRPDGSPVLFCESNGDCLAYGPEAGNCTAGVLRKCFLNPLGATGVADPAQPRFVATTCIGRTGGSLIDSAFGLPGPIRFSLTYNVSPP